MIDSRRMRWAGHVARVEAKSNAYKILVLKPEGKRPLKRPRQRGGEDIKIYLREIEWGGMKWIHLAQYVDQNRVGNS
jgi:hypothetical protein